MLGLLPEAVQVYVADKDTVSRPLQFGVLLDFQACCELLNSSGVLRCLKCSPLPLDTLMVPLQDPLEESDLVTIAELGLRLVSRPLGEIMSHAESLARAKRWALAWVQGGSQALEGAVGADADLCEFLHPILSLVGLPITQVLGAGLSGAVRRWRHLMYALSGLTHSLSLLGMYLGQALGAGLSEGQQPGFVGGSRWCLDMREHSWRLSAPSLEHWTMAHCHLQWVCC